MSNLVTIPITDTKLLDRAFTHRSFLNEHEQVTKHNERLEYLGDAVLELAVSEYLFQTYPDKPEGELTAFRASLVKTTTLAETAKTLGFGTQLKLSRGEEMSGGRENTSLLANTFEAVMGAIYLSDGYEPVVAFLKQHLFPKLEKIIAKGLHKDYKSSLQEYIQSKGHSSPEYRVVHESGPDHNKHFTISVLIDKEDVARGSGKSKQTAQQEAARAALEKLGVA